MAMNKTQLIEALVESMDGDGSPTDVVKVVNGNEDDPDGLGVNIYNIDEIVNEEGVLLLKIFGPDPANPESQDDD